MITVTVDFRGTQELLSKEKILEEIHEKAKSICVSENEVQRLIESTKEKSIHKLSL